MQKIWESSNFKEIYNVNTTPFESGFPTLRVQTFCHSVSYQNWKNGNGFSRPNIIAFLILSGNQQIIHSDGTKEKVGEGYFSMLNLNTIDVDFLTTGKKTERYFILFEINPLLSAILKEMFPAGLPSFNSPAPEKLKKLFENIRDAITENSAEDSRIGGAAYSLLHEVMTQLPANPLPVPLQLACSYIDNNFHRTHLSREEIARHSCVSISTLAAIFRKHLTTTIWQYISNKRMENVKQLLTYSNKPINEIAVLCGFSYSYYLTREFKSRFGITPFQYRRTSRHTQI